MRNIIQIKLNNSIYPKKAVLEAKQAFSSYLESTLKPVEGGVLITLNIKQVYQNDTPQIYGEFMNYLLDRTIQIALEKESI